MHSVLSVLEVIAPLFTAISLGVLARRKQILTQSEIQGIQQFSIRFGLPCMVFNSCLNANINMECLSSLIMMMIPGILITLWSFHARKKQFPYHNLPVLFSARETGMLGIPLFLLLFGADEVYRLAVLNLAQSIPFYASIAIVTSSTGETPSSREIAKSVLTSPLLIASVLGLTLNLSGISAWMDAYGIGSILKGCVSFLSQPVSTLMIFSVGYTFSLDKGCRRDIFRVSLVHFVFFAVTCLLAQLIFFLLPDVHNLTRWAVLMFCISPPSYLAPGMGRSQEDQKVASGVCSLLTAVCLLAFCVITVFVT